MKISIIIPTINESETLPKLVEHLRGNAFDSNYEIIIADGGSTDETLSIAENLSVQIVHSEKGRSKQMNAGALKAGSEILYFLHADSFPPLHFDRLIREAIGEGYESGCFRMKFDSRHWFLRISGWLTRFRSSWCRGGDQSLFVTKAVFEKAGKFDEKLIIYEDNEILKRLKKYAKFAVIQKDIITSARKYDKNGVIRLQMIFLSIHLKYRFGVSHDKLLEYYKRKVR